ncbi:REP-associated tyrosine transposase [Geoalkalibacter sp.]|uniref:REP-associated tyrosine transposase n=1 Tax=Geoalkalibacter sp. TaxID=3041440 RepID=UPI00272E3C8C|nr:transposase [Geoalkalibacter sp.]
MARSLRINYPGAFYHVTSRGNERRDVFKGQRDREKFLSYLESAVFRYGAVVHCWCLMGNHYHLLVETPEGNLPQIMRHINGAYTTYFNAKRKRSGHLFQGRYKAWLVEADVYALELSRYMHLNPVRAGLVSRPEDYLWSSYRSFIGHVGTPDWLKTQQILGCLGQRVGGAPSRYREFVEDRLGKEYESPLQDAVAGSILGCQAFIDKVKHEHVHGRVPAKDVPALRQLKERPRVEDILNAVGEEVGVSEKEARRIGIYLSHSLSGLPLRQLGEIFGMGETALCEASRRMKMRISVNPELAQVVAKIRDRVNL